MLINARSPKDIPLGISDEPGPATYDANNTHYGALTQPSSVFASTVPRSHLHHDGSSLGPGCYDPAFNITHSSKHSGTMPSQAPRFPSHNKENTTSVSEQFEKEFSTTKKEFKPIGKVIGMKEKKEKQSNQILPSIPSSQASYGYRYDQNTQKLQLNSDPKIVFARGEERLDGEGVHFQRQKSSIVLNKGFTIGARRQEQQSVTANLVLDNSSGEYGTIAELSKKKVNPFAAGRVENIPQSRDLVLDRLKRQFQEYMPQGVTLQQLKASKNKQSDKSPSQGSKGPNQCFMSKQKRFHHKKTSSTLTKHVNKAKLLSLATQKSTKDTQKQEKAKEKAIPQPFAKGEQRWKEGVKQAVGPGSYESSSPLKHSSSGILLNQKQTRFKDTNKQGIVPGPGTYQTELSKQQRKNEPFKRCGRESPVDQQGCSMECLYQTVGKCLNAIERQGKGRSRKQQRSKHNKERERDWLNLRKNLEKTMGPVQGSWVQKQRTMVETIPRHHHMYGYNVPPEKTNGAGPGYYEVRTELGSKTFNATACKPVEV